VDEWLSLLAIAVIAVGAALWWVMGKPPAVFVVLVRDGRPKTFRGKVTDAFLAAVADVFREFGLDVGEVRGVTRGRRIALWFSSGVPPGACQRMRNWWAMSGWPAAPHRG
jgi:hypothetical protein